MNYFLSLLLSIVATGYFTFMIYLSGSLNKFFGNALHISMAAIAVLIFIAVSTVCINLIKNVILTPLKIINIVFVTILGVFLFGNLLGINLVENISLVEKRNLNKFPKRSPFHEEFPKEFNKFIDDRIGLKNYAFTTYSKIKPFLLDRYNIKKNALLGDDNWLFYNNEGDNIINYQGLTDYKDTELSSFVNIIDNVSDFCNQHGIKFVLMITPNKSSIYPEYYPKFIKRLNKPSSYEILNDYVKTHSKATVVDVFDALMSNKNDKGLLFYKADTHWSSYGAYFAYKELASAINEMIHDFKVVNDDDVYRCDSSRPTYDLLDMIGGTNHNYLPTAEYCIKDPVELNVIKKAETYQLGYVTTSNKEGVKAIIFQDSFFGGISNFFYEGISEGINVLFYHRSPLLYKDLILQYSPDLIVWEIQERYAKAIAKDGLYQNAKPLTFNIKK